MNFVSCIRRVEPNKWKPVSAFHHRFLERSCISTKPIQDFPEKSRPGFYNCITVQWLGFTAKSVGCQGAVIWYLSHWVTLEKCDNNETAHPCVFTGLFFLRCFLTPHIPLHHNNVIIWGQIPPSCFTEGLCSSSAGLSVSLPSTPGSLHLLFFCLLLFS